MKTEGTVAYYALSLAGCTVRYIGRFSDDRVTANAVIAEIPQIADEVALSEPELNNLRCFASCAVTDAMLDDY